MTAIRSFGPYDGWLRDAIIAMKYAGEWGRQEHLGAALAEVVARTPADAILVPVPLHRGRLRERGFNQSELLARAASRSLGRPLVAALERQRATPHQVGLGGVERQANVAGAFRLAAGCDVAGETVVLVDDVLTTRATLGECGRILRHGGAREVWAAVLARE